MIRFLGIPLLVVASLLVLGACNGKSSSNGAEQSSGTASTAADATTAAPSPMATTPVTVYGVAVFPGARVQPPSTVNLSGANTTVLSVDETYREVFTWYDARNPGVPQTQLRATMDSDVFTIKAGKNTVKVTVSDTPDHQNTIITYVRL
jgi:hypothetical protein